MYSSDNLFLLNLWKQKTINILAYNGLNMSSHGMVVFYSKHDRFRWYLYIIGYFFEYHKQQLWILAFTSKLYY